MIIPMHQSCSLVLLFSHGWSINFHFPSPWKTIVETDFDGGSGATRRAEAAPVIRTRLTFISRRPTQNAAITLVYWRSLEWFGSRPGDVLLAWPKLLRAWQEPMTTHRFSIFETCFTP